MPVHVTLRARPHVWSFRTVRAYTIFADALRGVAARPGFGVVHFSALSNHIHLITEAESGRDLANGMRALTGRLAKGLNRLMRTSGAVFVDRFHAHVLRTPREAQNAVAYVLGNFASHLRRAGAPAPDARDPYSSAAELCADGLPPPVVAARTWLLQGAAVAREPVATYLAIATLRRAHRAHRRAPSSRGTQSARGGIPRRSGTGPRCPRSCPCGPRTRPRSSFMSGSV
jgi:REP element-mobilizing transposase RayT